MIPYRVTISKAVQQYITGVLQPAVSNGHRRYLRLLPIALRFPVRCVRQVTSMAGGTRAEREGQGGSTVLPLEIWTVFGAPPFCPVVVPKAPHATAVASVSVRACSLVAV